MRCRMVARPARPDSNIIGAERAKQVAMTRALIEAADRDLRHPSVLVVDRVARDPDFRPDNVLMEGEAVADTQRCARAAGVEFLAGIAHLEPVVEAGGRAISLERIVGQVDTGVMGGAANAAIGFIAGDDGPWRYPATCRAAHIGNAPRQEKLAARFDIKIKALGRCKTRCP